jgi:hypothetical protein
MKRNINQFSTIRIEGSILPPDLLVRITNSDPGLGGLASTDYHLLPQERLNEAINRSWNRMIGAWSAFRDAVAKLPDEDLKTTSTRERWLLPLFQELGYGRLSLTRSLEVKNKSYPVSHLWENTPIHLIGCKLDLDTRVEGVTGAARMSPHGMIQDLLNNSEEYLWGIVSNGYKLRILRDNVSLVRQTFVEFDLEAMMEGQVYADFVLLWLVCHQSRVEKTNSEPCWLERWSRTAHEEGTRVLDRLRDGVTEAIAVFGSGFLAHQANRDLKSKLRSGQLDKQDFYRQILRLVYRLIFIFVAEDRELLFDLKVEEESKSRYNEYYSSRRLRQLAGRHRGYHHHDLFHSLRIVMHGLGGDQGCPALGLPALGGFLFSNQAIPDIESCEISNIDFLKALRVLSYFESNGTFRPVNYKNIGSEELGSIYESLLELHPVMNLDANTFELNTVGGNERKTTGSYYTPTCLIQCLLDSALEPVLDDLIAGRHLLTKNIKPLTKKDIEQAILKFKVCDPACGSGHFLVAAAHRIAKRLAVVRTGEDEPAPRVIRHALRDVIGHCIYGVDINPMSVELCKVGLWMEALEPGKPLNFLDHHLRVGNSLFGTTPELIKAGLPDDAFKPIEGDDGKACLLLKRRNKVELEGLGGLFTEQDVEAQNFIQQAVNSFEQLPDDRPEDIHAKEEAFQCYQQTVEYRYKKQLADAWCASFVIKKYFREPAYENSVFGITQGHLKGLATSQALPDELNIELEKLLENFKFFHWYLAFPEVFANGGFNCILGNPPWEKIQLEEEKFFAQIAPDIAKAYAKKRKESIQLLERERPEIYALYQKNVRDIKSQTHFLKDSGRFPLSSAGNISTHSLFIELATTIISPSSRVGLVVPSGLATQDTQKYLFSTITSSGQLIQLLDFENRENFFPSVDTRFHFCLVTIGPRRLNNPEIEFAFSLNSIDDIRLPKRTFRLSYLDLCQFSPNTMSCPQLVAEQEALLLKKIYQAGKVIFRESTKENPWGWHSWQVFNETHEANLLVQDKMDNDVLPLYEGKLFNQFDHRFASYVNANQVKNFSIQDKQNPGTFVRTRSFIPRDLWNERIAQEDYNAAWILAFRRITNATNERTSIFCILPTCITSSQSPIVKTNQDAISVASLLGNLNSIIFDYVVRRRVGGTDLNHFIIHQLQIITPTGLSQQCTFSGQDQTFKDWLFPRILELTYTAWDLEPFAKDCNQFCPPFRWDEDRRFLIRCEIDAAFFHLYLPATVDGQWKRALISEGAEYDESLEDFKRLKASFSTPRDAALYIMDTFPIVRRKDEEKYNGDYRTKRIILEIYDAMQESIRTGKPYQTRLNPLPGPPVDARNKYIPMDQWDYNNWPSHIHLPRVKKERLEEVPFDEFVLKYPNTDTERAICAAALAIIEQSDKISSINHLDILMLTTHPDWCKVFLDPQENKAFDSIVKLAPQSLFVKENQSIQWKKCRDYLEKIGSISVNRRERNQTLSIGKNAMSIKTNLPNNVNDVVKFAIKVMKMISALREDISSVQEDKLKIIHAFEEQHRIYQLSA